MIAPSKIVLIFHKQDIWSLFVVKRTQGIRIAMIGPMGTSWATVARVRGRSAVTGGVWRGSALFKKLRSKSGAGSLVAGMSWITVLATINVSAQVALPGWVRGRGLSIFGTVMFGSLTVGTAVWGKVAAFGGLPAAHILAGLGR
jgi:hypothetical protein